MESDPIFFLHFPRTAGTTIDKIFSLNLYPENIIHIYSKDEYNKYSTIEIEKFQNIKYITGHLLLEKLNPTTFYGQKVRAFTILRNPAKRLFSEYNFLKTWKNQHLYNFLNSNNISFSEYITSKDKLLFYRGKNFMTRCLSGDSLEKTNDLTASLEKAKYNLLNTFWFYGLQERFMESLLLLAEKAKLNNILHQRHNALKLHNENSKLTDNELEILYEYNRADIELYKFAEERFDSLIKSRGKIFQQTLKNFTFLNTKFQKLAGILYNHAYQNENSNQKIQLSKETKW